MDEGIGSKIKRIMHSYQLLFSNVTSKAKSTRHVYIYKMTCMFLTTFIFKSLSPFRIPGLWMQVYILCLSSSRSSFNPFSFYRRGLQEQGTMMVDFMPYASLTVCIIYIFQLFWLCHWLFGRIMRKMKNLRHGRYRPNCLQTKLGLLYVYVFPYPCFFPQCQVLSKWGEGAIERAYGYCQIWCTSCNWPAWEKNAPTGCYNGGDCVKSGDTSRCRGKKENSRQTSFSPLALSAKRTPTPTTCLAVTNNSSIQKCLHQDTQNHGAGTTAKRRIRKGVDADARPGVGAGRTGGLTCPCLRR